VFGPALELAAVVVAAAASLRWPLVALIVVLAAGSVSRWARGKGWVEYGRPAAPMFTVAGAGLGLVALAGAVALASPALEALTTRSVDWTQLAAVRGNASVLLVAVLVVAAQAVALELGLRRWLLERVHDLGARAHDAAVVAAIAEGAITGGHLGTRLGAAMLGLGVGLVYVGGGRRLAPAIACRIALETGALVLVWARWI
jgi:hypothetical protein